MYDQLLYKFKRGSRYFSFGPISISYCRDDDANKLVELSNQERFYSLEIEDRLLLCKDRTERLPKSIVITESIKCNKDCSFCYMKPSRNNNSIPVEMSPETINKTIELIQLMMTQNEDPINVFLGYGGEPTINLDRIQAIVDLCNNKLDEGSFYTFYAPTNGILLTDENILEFYIKQGFIGITIDFSELSKPALSKHIVNTLQTLSSKIYVAVTTVIHPEAGDLLTVLSTLHHYGVQLFTGYLVRGPIEGDEIALHGVEHIIDMYELFSNQIQDVDPTHAIQLLSLLSENDLLGRVIHRLVKRDRLIWRCPAGGSAISIDTKGIIYPCSSIQAIQKLPLGSIFDGLNQEKRNIFGLPTLAVAIECQKCPIRYICGGPCAYVGLVVHDDPFRPEKNRCKLFNRLLEIAIEIIDSLNGDLNSKILNMYNNGCLKS